MAQRKKSNVVKSAAKIGSPDEAKSAFEEMRPELDRLSADEVLAVNVDVPRAVSIALGAEPHIRAHEAEIQKALPLHTLEHIRRLRIYALGTVYAYLESLPLAKRADAKALLEEAGTLKERLLVAADALAHAELIDGAKLDEIRAGNGHLDLATDLIALGATFDLSWERVASKTAIDRSQVERASALGTELLGALGARDHAANRVAPEALDRRNRAFTLLVRAYDDARRALAYLRWNEDDVDMIAPSLYTRTRKRAANSVEEVEETTPSSTPTVNA